MLHETVEGGQSPSHSHSQYNHPSLSDDHVDLRRAVVTDKDRRAIWCDGQARRVDLYVDARERGLAVTARRQVDRLEVGSAARADDERRTIGRDGDGARKLLQRAAQNSCHLIRGEVDFPQRLRAVRDDVRSRTVWSDRNAVGTLEMGCRTDTVGPRLHIRPSDDRGGAARAIHFHDALRHMYANAQAHTSHVSIGTRGHGRNQR